MTEDQKQNVQKWIAALRSGKYEQAALALCVEYEATEELEASEKFCCLGVACELYQKEGPGGLKIGQREPRPNMTPPYGHRRTYDGTANHLPDRVREWLGLRDTHGPFIPDDLPNGVYGVRSLSMLNDGSKLSEVPRHTFEQIADFIEESLEKPERELFETDIDPPRS